MKKSKSMSTLYQKIIEQIVKSGKRLREKSGKIKDIGVTKKYLTEEDIRIERELKQVVKEFDPKQGFCAEEENENFSKAKDVWVVDPISGTHVFISGLPHYAIVASHLHCGEVCFAAVYDPSMDNLYTAYKNKGAYLNGQRIFIKKAGLENPKIIFGLSLGWKDTVGAKKLFCELSHFELYRLLGSQAVSDSLVACGKYYNGVVCLAKDSFTCFAGSLMIREAGGIFTNLRGEEKIKPSDRVFIGGDKETYRKLKAVVGKILK